MTGKLRSPPPEERQLALLVALLRSRRAMTRAELYGALPEGWRGNAASSRRKFERDKRALRDLGVELHFDPARGCYSLDSTALRLGRLDLSPAEGVLLRQAAAAAVEDPAFPYAPEVLGALVRLSAAARTTSPLADPPSDLLVHHPAVELAEHPELAQRLAKLLRAVRRRLPVTFEYRRPWWPAASTRRLEPWGLFCRRGRWSVVGRCVDLAAERTYRLSGIEGLQVVGLPDSGPRFERPPGCDPAAAANRPPWRFDTHQEREVLVAVDAELAEGLARRLGESELRGEAAAGPRGPRRLVAVRVTDAPALLRALRAELPRVAVLGPPDLAESWAAPLRRLLLRHRCEA